MTSLNHSNNLCHVTLYFPLPPSNVASPNGSASLPAKPTGSATPEKKSFEQIKKDINEEVKKLAETIKELETSQNNPLTDEDQKRLSDCQSKLSALQTVHKLAEFADQLDTNKNTNNNILNNLCTGLETLLGFDSDSKGYDGQGIVYSDLDRLCDAVMAFLYNVLKDVSEKQPYSVGKNDLKEFVDTVLLMKLSTGREGFSVIAQVAEKVGEYNESVRKQNDDIKNKITDLDSQMKQLKQSVSEDLKRNAAAGAGRIVQGSVDSADQLVEASLNNANKFNKSLDTDNDENVRNAINDLNSIVRDDVNKARACVKLETEQLTALSSKQQEDRKVMREKIERLLTDLGSCVNDSIKKKVAKLVEDLGLKVKEIRRKLEEIQSELVEYIRELTTWIGQAELLIKSAFGKVEAILKEVNEGDSEKRPMLITSAIEQIKAAVAMLHGAGEEARKQVKEKVTAALKQVKEMNDELKKDLYKVKTQIKNELWNHVRDHIKTPYDKLEGKVKDGLWKIEEAITKDLKSILSSTSSFKDKFEATKGAILSAIRKVHEDLNKFKYLFNNVKIAGQHGDVPVPLLTEIGKNGDEFMEPLTSYLTKLDSDVMRHVNDAMKKIGDGMENFGNIIGGHAVDEGFRKLKPDLETSLIRLKNIIAGSGSTLDTNTIKSFSGITIDVAEFNHNGALSVHSSAFETVYNKLYGTLRSQKVTQEDVKNLLNALGKIAEAVSAHSKSIVEKVVGAIKKEVKSEIAKVTQIIINDANNIQMDIEKHVDEKQTYGLSTAKEKSRGLKWLKDNFDEHIKQALEKLQLTVEAKFKQTGTGSRSKDNYEFGEKLMNTFKTAYDDLKNGKLKQDQFEKDVADKLTAEIGNDGKTGAGLAGDTISALAVGKFVNYDKQVNQESLATISDDNPEPINGQLSAAIKEIRTDVVDALKKIDGEKKYAEDQLAQITSSLESLCQAVKSAGENAQSDLKQLQDTYFNTSEYAKNGIRILKYKLTNLQEDDLAKAIKEANQFLTDAQKIRDDTTRSLKIDVNTQVGDVKRQLTSELEKQYITTMALQLDHFADRVTEHLKGLPEAIEEDKHTGFKGFMEVFEGKPEVKPKEKWAIHVARDEPSRLDAFRSAVTKPRSSKKEEFKTLSEEFKKWYDPLNTYLIGELKRHHTETMSNRNPSVQVADGDPIPHTKNLGDLKGKLDAILEHLHDIPEARKYLFDHNSSTKLDTLKSALDHLRPAHFANIKNPALVDALKSGMNVLVGELSKTYLNAYDGGSEGMILVDKKYNKVTEDGMMCAKVCLSLLSILNSDLKTLKMYSGVRWRSEVINKSSELGKFLVQRGFNVSEGDKKHWELQDKGKMAGFYIYRRMVKDADNYIYKHHDIQKDTGALKHLCEHLEEYYQVCHISCFTVKKHPCSVFDMLCWLCGLPCNSVYEDMLDATISDLFEDPKKQPTDDDGITLTDTRVEYLAAYPQSITYNDTRKTVMRLSLKSHDVLTRIVGYGNAYTTYAVDYCTNSRKLYYPPTGEDCLQMLLDILRRLFPVFRFLYSQCGAGAHYNGWADCLYGKDIATTKSRCKNHPTDEATCESKCQTTSPLMCYLNDCLPGHLPHQLTSIGCKSKCSNCPSTCRLGMPCITPLGFRGFSGSVKTGSDIYEVIGFFFGSGLVSSLFCLVTIPPSTLPEHFQFVSTLVNALQHGADAGTNSVRTAFETSTKNLSIDLCRNPAELTDALRDAYCSTQSHDDQQHPEAAEADLSTLSKFTSCIQPKEKNIHCGPYLSSTCCDVYNYLAEKHSDLYLSWAVYLPWTFYNYLKSLLDAFQQIDCEGTGCSRCKCKPGSHGVEFNCKCNALVSCRSVLPTFFQYGFAFGDMKALHSTERRYCHNFRAQLNNVLSSTYFATLFDRCDDFLFQIRAPFLWMTVALWSLSLFYLVCVMVGRLDVLHIRSHLRIPSSHKITAQSLLAAAQVGRLAKISYLQP